MRYKGQYHDDFDAILLSIGERQQPQKEFIEYGKVPGSSLALYQDTGTYQPYERQVQILSKAKAELTDIYQWLSGSGQLWIDEDGYYNARVLNVDTSTESLMLGWTRLTVTFEVQPFLFLESQDMILTSGQTIYNPGIESDPYIKITGSGIVTLTVNGVAYTINPVDQSIEIEWPFAWKGMLNKGKTLSGFPKLKPGNNTISWTGAVTEVLLNGRWRTL